MGKTNTKYSLLKQIWKNTFQSYRQPFIKDLHYRLHYSTKTNDYMHKCSNDNKPSCDHCRTHRRQLTLIHKMFKNTKNLDALSNHTYKTDRKNLYPVDK